MNARLRNSIGKVDKQEQNIKKNMYVTITTIYLVIIRTGLTNK